MISNPNLKLTIKRIGSEPLAVILEAPIRGKHLQINKINKQDNPTLFNVLIKLSQTGQQTILNHELVDQLKTLGVLVEASEVSEPVYFSCPLDHQIFPWIPKRFLNCPIYAVDTNELIVNPTYLFQENTVIPESIRHRVLEEECFQKGFSKAWVEDPGTHLLIPYWINDKERNFFAHLKPGQKIPSIMDMDDEKIKLLKISNILVSPSYISDRLKQWAVFLDKARHHFREYNYAILENIIPPLQLAAMRYYYRERIAEGWVHWGETYHTKRFHAQNDSLSSFFHRQISNVVSLIAEKPLKNSYNYVPTYLNGSELKLHQDTEQHEYGISLLVDYEPEPIEKSAWPIKIIQEKPIKKPISIFQSLGEAVFFKGSLEHFRDVFTEGQRSTSLLLHFISADFKGEMEYSPYY